MLVQHRSVNRPFSLGPHSFELLQHAADPRTASADPDIQPCPMAIAPVQSEGLAGVCLDYANIFRSCDPEAIAEPCVDLPDDPNRRTEDLKGFGYFLDADFVGVCRFQADHDRVSNAVVVAVAWPRLPESDNAAHEWVAQSREAIAHMRADEIGSILARYMRRLGSAATLWPADDAHAGAVTDCALAAGLLVKYRGNLICPILDNECAIVVIETDYLLQSDRPLLLPPDAWFDLKRWLGVGGARSLREKRRQQRRRSDLSKYPMETVKRQQRPTTLIIDDEVPRVPKRAAFFARALAGDLGEKAQKERLRFAFKHPTASAMMPAIGSLVPHQNGDVREKQPGYSNPDENTRALKSLSYALGADLTGICEIPDYAWFSHGTSGKPIVPYHRYALVMLIDQGYDTMEGASGDDWISGSQSMRGYLRGAEIAGIMAKHLRQLGFSARSHTNADSDLLHIPLLLWAGLGELSRIGELVLNPFVGPRFKSVVLTTDMPLTVDQPIDFGLQEFCRNCLKCARECPCDAIPWGEPVVYNGYEMYKPDVERCTRYRLTNARGAACGRCMKTCPINKVVDADGGMLTRAGSWLGVNARWLKPLMVPFAAWFDDAVGNGKRNLVKKWWLDLEEVDGKVVAPKGTNTRDIDPHKTRSREQPIAYYPASVNPPGDASEPFPVDRKAAVKAGDSVETPAMARARVAAGGATPEQYIYRG